MKSIRWRPVERRSACRPVLALIVLALAVLGGSSAAQASAPAPDPAFADAFWLATSGDLLKLRLGDGSLLERRPEVEGAYAVAVDEEAARVWAFTAEESLTALDFAGGVVASVPFPGQLEDGSRVRLAAGGGFAWLGFEEVVYQVDGAGELVASFPLSSDLRDLAFTCPRLWIADRREVTAYDLAGQPLAALDLGPHGQIVALAPDGAGGLWVADKQTVLRYGPDLELLAQVAYPQPRDVASAAGGGAWVAGRREVARLGPDGARISTTAIPGGGGGSRNLFALAAEPPANETGDFVWAVAKDFLFQVDGEGGVARTLRLRDFGPDLEAQGAAVYTDRVVPEIAFTAPPEEALLAIARPVLELAWSDAGIGVDPASLAVTANGATLAVTCASPSATGASCTPDAPLPEGPVTLSATVADFRGNRSPAATRTIVIDSVPPPAPNPGLIEVEAPSGGQVQVVGGAGSVEGGATVTVTSSSTGAAVSVAAGADGSFEAIIEAAAGDLLTVVAVDAAGNTSPPTELQVPGQPADPTLPPDPTTVAPPLDRTVAIDLFTATEFLYTGPDPIQTGVAPGTIEARRAAVLRGRVLDREGAPLPGVEITVHGHPEYGRTLSRADGAFDLVVNGGGLLTLDYRKEGYLPVQRQMRAPWRDFAWAPEVVLTPLDPAVTVVTSGAAQVQVARGTTQSDGDGARTATLLLPAGITAEMELADGSRRPLSQLSLRATEYTVGPRGPAAMPGPLPANVGYTYAVELSADEALAAGARRVLFSQPAFFYLESFLAFPVGEVVPAGYYDDREGAWIASDNGRVIRLLGVDGAGRAELDVDGTGTAAPSFRLAQLGFSDGERRELARLYPVGQELWRAPVPHLTPWDYNWPYAPPEDAEAPPEQDPGEDEGRDEEESDCTEGSIIECQNQTLQEEMELVGTPFRLVYRSDRVAGRAASFVARLMLSGETVPASLEAIELEVSVAGRRLERTFPAAPHQSFTYTWDGTDAYGRPVQGTVPLTLTLSYVYQLVYLSAPEFEQSWARFPEGSVRVGGRRLSAVARLSRTRTYWVGLDDRPGLGGWDARALGLGGWFLDVHHAYDPGGRRLYLGGGGRRSAQGLPPLVYRSAGTGVHGYGGDGGPAELARLSGAGIAVGAGGSLYVADRSNHRVRRVDPSGVIQTVAGSGEPCQPVDEGEPGPYCGDGGPALLAQLTEPNAVALGPEGELYVADTNNHCVRRVGADGLITTVAGQCAVGGPGPVFSQTPPEPAEPADRDLNTRAEIGCDDCPAVEALLRSPVDVEVAPDGGFYISDSENDRIRHVTPDGRITTVAGGGSPDDFLGDGGPAREADLFRPRGIALGPDGSLYVAQGRRSRVRRVDPSGMITTVAGTGRSTYCGDGGPAVEACLSFPAGVAAAPDGSLLIADSNNRLVRQVTPDGLIRTLAGRYDDGPGGGTLINGAAATGTELGLVEDVALAPDGALFLAQGASVLRVSAGLPGFAEGEILIPNRSGRELYRFDARGRHRRTVDPLTGTVRHLFGYDQDGRLTSIRDAAGNQTRIERDATGRAIGVVAPFGQRTELAHGADGLLAAITNPAGESHQFTYDDQGLLTTWTDPRGQTRRYTYRGFGRLARAEDPAGGFKSLDRTALGDGLYWVELTTALGRTTRYQVQRFGLGSTSRLRRHPHGGVTGLFEAGDGTRTVTTPDGTQVILRRAPDPRWGLLAPTAGEVEVHTPGGRTATLSASRQVLLADPDDPLSLRSEVRQVTVNGRTYTGTYDAASRRWTFTTPAGRQRSVLLDDLGRPVELAIPGLAPLTFRYDGSGRLALLEQGAGDERRSLALAYDDEGWIERVTDPLARESSFDADPAGRVRSQILPGGESVTFGYDANGNLAALTPPARPAHGFGYTPVDLPARYAPPPVADGSAATTYLYSLDRQLTEVRLPGGEAIELAYDDGGRLTAFTTSRGTTTLTYRPGTEDPATLTTPEGSTLTYSYDGFLLTGTAWSGEVAGSVERSYDGDLRLAEERVNGAHPVAFAYDPDGLLVSAGDLTLTRDPATGLLTGTRLGAVTTSRAYNPFGEPVAMRSAVAGESLWEVSYTRDRLGRISRKRETVAGTTDVYDYTYDPAGRLTRVEKDGAVFAQYGYDANGNRLSYDGTFGSLTATYDDQDRLLTYGATAYIWTADGRLRGKSAGDQTVTYRYDELGNLLGVTLPDGIEIDDLLDARGRRIGKKVNGARVQGFLYKDRLNPVAELDGAGNVVARFVYGSRTNVPDYMVKGGTTYRFLSDHLGSVRLVVDVATGTVAQRLDYDEFGRVILDTHPGLQPFAFAGGLYDPQTGLTRFGARDYDPEVGRWTAKDPILFGGGDSNLYLYVANDPLNLTDPSGLARLCHRPLDGVVGTLSELYPTPGISDRLDRENFEPLHEQFLFDDGQNYGFFPDGVRPDEGHDPDDYTCRGRQYDDDTLRRAIENEMDTEDYSLRRNNCQDWTDEVLEEYERLRQEQIRETGLDPELEFVWNQMVGADN